MKNTHRLALLAFMAFPLLPLTAQQTDVNLVRSHVEILASDNLKGRGFGTPEGEKAAIYISSQFEAAGIEPLLETYFHAFDYRQGILNIRGRNVVGVIRGSDPALNNEYIILGAHYDHLGWELQDGDTVAYNGADDNASGVAAIIETGRFLADNRKELKRSVILIAFDGEESGLVGSKQFVKDLVVDMQSVKAMFSLDMVGMYKQHKGLDMKGLKLIENYEPLLEKAVAKSPITLTKINDAIEARTDTAPFGKAGVPAIAVFTGMESPYHKPEDDAENLDFEGMATVVDFMGALTLEMSQSETLTSTGKLPNPESQYKKQIVYAGLTIKTGNSYFDYPDEFYQGKSAFAFGAGAFLQIRLAEFLTLQPEVQYERSGGPTQPGNLFNHSVTTPVSLLLTTPDPQDNRVRAYFQAGGYFSYSFAGNIDGNPIYPDDAYNRQQFGLILGGGLEIMNMRIGYVHTTSFTNLWQNTSNGNMLLNGSYFTMGWAF